jgi:hypothetical protein
MIHQNSKLIALLDNLDFGASIAEQDNLLETARVETSVFNEVLSDKVDLIPGTKGSGKSAMYRIIVEFLRGYLAQQKRIVIAHGVSRQGDNVFHVFRDKFGRLSEDDFIDFWCVYLVSLANEHFLKAPEFAKRLKPVADDIKEFQSACRQARIPPFEQHKSLREVLEWALTVIQVWRPKLTYSLPGDGGKVTLDLFGTPVKSPTPTSTSDTPLPLHVAKVKLILERILERTGLHLWLMIDRLDEIFPRRSDMETNALRGLLRALRLFESPRMRLKIFLRDDILDQIVSKKRQGFTALSHVTARKAKTLQWSEDQIRTMIVNRVFANRQFADYLRVTKAQLAKEAQQERAFSLVFPPAVYAGAQRTSTTLRWIYRHCADARGVVTPRDVIQLLTSAKQKQIEDLRADATGQSESIIGPLALRYGFTEMSKLKRTTFLHAEFPHLWPHIEKYIGGKTEYDEHAVRKLHGSNCDEIVEDLMSIGVLHRERRRSDGVYIYKIPFLYRDGLQLTQGRMRW